jgi:hypothetical protein
MNTAVINTIDTRASRVFRAIETEQLQNVCPSIFAEAPHSRTSDDYSFVPTSSIIEGMKAEGFVPVYAKEQRVRDEDRKGFQAHQIRFRHQNQINNPTFVGDVFPEVILNNAHDASKSYQVRAGLYRLACANGMVVGQATFGGFRLRHTDLTIQAALVAAHETIAATRLIGSRVERYKQIILPNPAEFAAQAIALRWPDEPTRISPDSVLRVRRSVDYGNDLWTVFNRTQEALTKGIKRARNESGERVTVRGIHGLNADLQFNEQLWNLAEGLALQA